MLFCIECLGIYRWFIGWVGAGVGAGLRFDIYFDLCLFFLSFRSLGVYCFKVRFLILDLWELELLKVRVGWL